MFWERASTGGIGCQRTGRLVCFGSSRAVEGVNGISVKVLGVSRNAFCCMSVFLVLCGDLPAHAGRVLLQGDSEAAVQWCVAVVGKRNRDMGPCDALSASYRNI
ncbi:unnamed protein product [Laminaria digitata]